MSIVTQSMHKNRTHFNVTLHGKKRKKIEAKIIVAFIRLCSLLYQKLIISILTDMDTH